MMNEDIEIEELAPWLVITHHIDWWFAASFSTR